MEWFAREARAAQALQAPEWVDPELAVTCLQHVEVRGDERWLPAKFGALSELALRGRPRPQLVPPSCRALTLSFQVCLPMPVKTHVSMHYSRACSIENCSLNISKPCTHLFSPFPLLHWQRESAAPANFGMRVSMGICVCVESLAISSQSCLHHRMGVRARLGWRG